MKTQILWTASLAGLLVATSALARQQAVSSNALGPATLASNGWQPPHLGDLAVETVPVISGELGPPILAPEHPLVDIAICLDTSGSMDGLLEAAKQKLWAIVNEFIFAEPLPRLRVALLTYGNNGHSEELGWVKLETDLTEDLDLVSERLFVQTTNGGTELVGRVVNAAAERLAWSPEPGALKLIVVAGNETADQDQVIPFGQACARAIGRDIMVNAIYCGNPADADAESWRQVAQLADGQFAAIDQQHGTVVVATPFDERLTELSSGLNGTYLAYGPNGAWNGSNQIAQDCNAANLNGEAAASRALTKANFVYNCATWDLVDGVRLKQVVLAELAEEDLPEAMRSMTLEERERYVASMAEQRAGIQVEINGLAQRRQQFVDTELKKQQLDTTSSFDSAFRAAVRSQAAARGYRFPEAAPVALPAPVPAPVPATQGPAQGAASPPPAQTVTPVQNRIPPGC